VSLRITPMDRDGANAYVRQHHRHSKSVVGYKFAVAVAKPSPFNQPNNFQFWETCGVAIAGRPVARALDDGMTLEILRVCTDGARNACSKLYAACCRAARALGYRRAITYTLASEIGTSLRAAGFRPVAEVADRQWDCPSRPRQERDLVGGKVRWERAL